MTEQMIKRCLPVCVESSRDMLELLRKYGNRFDAFELWLDYLEDLDLQSVKAFLEQAGLSAKAKEVTKEVLLLFRRKQLEPSVTPLEVRKKMINALQSDQVLWDFDINVQEDELHFFRSKPRTARLICSYHNYTRTPSDDELALLVRKMEGYAPHVYKFATFVEGYRDALRLMKFLLDLHESGKRAIVLGMGEKGAITRVFGGEFGNAYTFLAVPSEGGKSFATAPGQFLLDQFEAILNNIKSFSHGGK